MKRLILTILLSLIVTVRGTDLPLVDGDRILMEGDSIMAAYKWIHYFQSYLILMNPSLTLHITSPARGGSSVVQHLTDPAGYGGYDEHDKRTLPYSPTYVMVWLGVNGADTPTLHATHMEDLGLNYIIAEDAATVIMTGTQPIMNSTGTLALGDKETAMIAMTATHGWRFAQVWHPLLSIWTNPSNWPLLNDPLIMDFAHPGTAGHILMAYTVITQLGFSTVVSTATINASNNTVTSHVNCTIGTPTTNAFSGVDFTRLDTKLPWAIDEAGRPDATFMMPALANWLTYSMTVTGLSSGTYNIYCDGVQIGANVSNTTLAAGWNMADLTSGPVWSQTQEVLGRLRDAQGVDRIALTFKSPAVGGRKFYNTANTGYGTGLRGSALKTYCATVISEMNALDVLTHAAAVPVTRTYSVQQVGATEQNGSQRSNTSRKAVTTPGF